METFFEAWVETLVRELAPRLGGSVRTGRQKQTLSPLTWDPPFVGSQRYLLPDVVLEREGHAIVFDAKYKAHWEDLNIDSWWGMEDEIRNRHREDLLQVLAYSTVFQTPRVTCCLVYPCRRATWESLRDRGRLIHRASVASGSRSVDLALTAVPMDFDRTVLDQLARVMS